MKNPGYLHLRAGEPPPPSGVTPPYRAVLVVEEAVSEEWQRQVSAWLVESGCRYALTWGRDCEAWHDSVDEANLVRLGFQKFSDDDLVMTTWHDDEPLADVFWFAEHCALHPSLNFDHTIVIHISGQPRAAELVRAFVEAQTESH